MLNTFYFHVRSCTKHRMSVFVVQRSGDSTVDITAGGERRRAPTAKTYTAGNKIFVSSTRIERCKIWKINRKTVVRDYSRLGILSQPTALTWTRILYPRNQDKNARITTNLFPCGPSAVARFKLNPAGNSTSSHHTELKLAFGDSIKKKSTVEVQHRIVHHHEYNYSSVRQLRCFAKDLQECDRVMIDLLRNSVWTDQFIADSRCKLISLIWLIFSWLSLW